MNPNFNPNYNPNNPPPYWPPPPDCRQLNDEMQREIFKLAERNKADLSLYFEKTAIAENAAIRLQEIREDVRVRSQLLTDKVTIDPNGELSRKQEFLREKPREFVFANFKLAAIPVTYITKDCRSQVLGLCAILENQRNGTVFFDLDRTDSGYYCRKFRNSGMRFKKKRTDRNELVFQIISALVESSERVELPKRPGFYLSEAGDWRYAGADDLTWEEVMEYAK